MLFLWSKFLWNQEKTEKKWFKNKNDYFHFNVCLNEFHVIFVLIKIIFWSENLYFLVRHRWEERAIYSLLLVKRALHAIVVAKIYDYNPNIGDNEVTQNSLFSSTKTNPDLE